MSLDTGCGVEFQMTVVNATELAGGAPWLGAFRQSWTAIVRMILDDFLVRSRVLLGNFDARTFGSWEALEKTYHIPYSFTYVVDVTDLPRAPAESSWSQANGEPIGLCNYVLYV